MSTSARISVAANGAAGAASGVPASSGSRLAGVDGLRAFAALWVVLFHIAAFSAASLAHVPGVLLFVHSGSTA